MLGLLLKLVGYVGLVFQFSEGVFGARSRVMLGDGASLV
jgi:hypothetical protein